MCVRTLQLVTRPPCTWRTNLLTNRSRDTSLVLVLAATATWEAGRSRPIANRRVVRSETQGKPEGARVAQGLTLISANRSCRVFSFASCRCSSFRAAPSSKGAPGPTCHKHTASNRRHVNVNVNANVSELRLGFSSSTASNRGRTTVGPRSLRYTRKRTQRVRRLRGHTGRGEGLTVAGEGTSPSATSSPCPYPCPAHPL
jgi:hypothetical protein